MPVCPQKSVNCESCLLYRGWYRLNCNPHFYVDILNFSAYECDLIWRSGLYRDNQVKMRLLGWALIQYHCCL